MDNQISPPPTRPVAISETDLRAMLDAFSDGIAWIDSSWTVVYLNSRAREIVSGAGDVLGKNHWECFPFMVYEGSPWVRHYHLAMDEGISSEFTEFYGEPLNIWVRVQVRPFQGGMIGFFRDVTAEKKLEEERNLYGKRLEQVLQATNDGVAYIDREWRITYLNQRAQEVLGASGDVIGKNHWEEFPATLDENAPFLSAYKRAMYEGIGSRFEFNYPEPLNICFDAICEPAPDGIVVFFRDLTQAKQTQQTLLQTEKLAAVGRLSASIAHEINNPLEAVTNLLYLMKTSEDVEEIHDFLNTAELELRRVSLIANQTLRFHRQATKAEAEFCHELIGDSLAVFQGRVVNNKISVEKRKRAEHPVDCFGGEIRQVLNNLIGNAVDAMASGGRLLLRSREATHHQTGRRGLVITVADTGTGMVPAVQKRVFEAFYTTKGIGGTGLGLWISSEIVKRHGGTLRFRSSVRPERSGTVFNLFLPFIKE